MERKKGQLSYISCSAGSCPSEMTAASAAPTPSQAGSALRLCVHAKIQGMARIDAMSRTPALRRAGREPMFRLPSSSSGVAS